MAEHRPNSLTEHASPPFRPHTPDPDHEAKTIRRPSIARAENAIRHMIFGNAKVNKHAAKELVHDMQRKDEEHYARFVSTEAGCTSQGNEQSGDQVDASEETKRIEESNEAGFGDQDDSQHGRSEPGNWKGPDAKCAVSERLPPGQRRKSALRISG